MRLERIKKREYARFGARILPGGDMYEQHRAFLKWASGFDTGGTDMRSIAQYDQWQKELRCGILKLDGTLPVETLADAVLTKLSETTKEQI